MCVDLTQVSAVTPCELATANSALDWKRKRRVAVREISVVTSERALNVSTSVVEACRESTASPGHLKCLSLGLKSTCDFGQAGAFG